MHSLCHSTPSCDHSQAHDDLSFVDHPLGVRSPRRPDRAVGQQVLMDDRQLAAIWAEIPNHLAPRSLRQAQFGSGRPIRLEMRVQLASQDSLEQARLIEQLPDLARLDTPDRRVLLLSIHLWLFFCGLGHTVA